MIPFPGESLPVFAYENRVGTPIPDLSSIQNRAGVSFFGTGAAAVVRVPMGFRTYLETDTDPGEVSWCVEVSGGSGSLTLTECLGEGEPDTLLGTFAVTAGAPLVVPSSVLTLADVFADSWASLLVECTTGPVDVQQVKLRAFPTGGALGGWGTELHPAWDRTSPAQGKSASRLDAAAIDGVYTLHWGVEGPTPITSGWENTLALMPDVLEGESDTEPIPVSTDILSSTTSTQGIDVNLHAESFSLPSPGESGGTVLINGSGIVLTRPVSAPDINPAEGLVDGVDYIANPYEVRTDDGALVQADTAPVNRWVTEYVVAGVPHTIGELITTDDNPGSDPPLGFPLIGALPWAPVDDGLGNIVQLWPDHAAGPPVGLSLPETDQVLVAGSHVWFRGDTAPPTPGVADPNVYSETRYNGFTWAFTVAPQYVTAMPPYRVWQVATAPVHKLRQYHRDDSLGIAPRRAYGGASRNHTGRAYGYT